MMLGVRGRFHKHMRQRAEVSTPTEMIPQDRRGKSRREGGRRLETKEKSKASSSKKKRRLNSGVGDGTGETKKSRNKASAAAAAKGRVAIRFACLHLIDS